jgi:hypothetical protein
VKKRSLRKQKCRDLKVFVTCRKVPQSRKYTGPCTSEKLHKLKKKGTAMWDRNATPIWKQADLNIEHVVGMGLSAEAGVKQVGQVGGRALQDGLHLLPPAHGRNIIRPDI